MPPAARITDMHVCPMVNPGPVPYVGGPTTSGEGTVLIGYQPAAWVGEPFCEKRRQQQQHSQAQGS